MLSHHQCIWLHIHESNSCVFSGILVELSYMNNSKIKRPVTMRNIAEAAGVHQSTVSRALRNDPLISEQVRKDIQAVASKLNYRPNPFVQAFTAQVRGYRRSPTHAAIAIIESQDKDFLKRYRKGASEHAAELGFDVNSLSLQDLNDSTSRLNDIIKARGIRGVLIMPVPLDNQISTLNFDHLASATIDYSLKSPHINRAAPNYFQNMQTALNKLNSLGYRRIGFCTYREEINHIGHHWLGAFKAWQTLQPTDERVSVHLNPFSNKKILSLQGEKEGVAALWDKNKQSFSNWVTKCKPDVVISNGFFFYSWLKELKYKIPQEIGFTTLNYYQDLPHISGIDENHETIAASAIDLILGQFHRNEYCLPIHRKTVLIEGTWNDGKTIRT